MKFTYCNGIFKMMHYYFRRPGFVFAGVAKVKAPGQLNTMKSIMFMKRLYNFIVEESASLVTR